MSEEKKSLIPSSAMDTMAEHSKMLISKTKTKSSTERSEAGCEVGCAVTRLDSIDVAGVMEGEAVEGKFGRYRPILSKSSANPSAPAKSLLVLMKERRICFDSETKFTDKQGRSRFNVSIECTQAEYEKYKEIEHSLIGETERSRVRAPEDYSPFIVADIPYDDAGTLAIELKNRDKKEMVIPTDKNVAKLLKRGYIGNFLLHISNTFEMVEGKSIKIKLVQASVHKPEVKKVVSTFLCD